MSDEELRRALAGAGAADAAARERARRIVLDAHAERLAAAPRRRRSAGRARHWLALAVTGVALGGASVGVATAGAPQSGVGKWVRGVLGRPVTAPATVPLSRIPGGGSLLVRSGGSLWTVSATGRRQRLGVFEDGAWSPHGKFAVGWHDRTLSAVGVDGRVRWSLQVPAAVRAAAWGPRDGFRIAYVAGSEVRLLNGDGTGDRFLAAARPEVAPAWRPDAARTLAFAAPDGRVTAIDVDSDRVLWRSAPVPGLVELAWAPAGGRLLALSRRAVTLLSADGRGVAHRKLTGDATGIHVARAPRGARAAIAQRSGGGLSHLVLVDLAAATLPERELFSAPGDLGKPLWSPDGRRLLASWTGGDQWLLLPARAGGRPLAIGALSRQFGPEGPGRAPAAAIGWCCARDPGVERLSGSAGG